MDIAQELTEARAEEERLHDVLDRARVELRAVEARIRELGVLERRSTRPQESLSDAIVRVVANAAIPLRAPQVHELLVADGMPGVSEGSVRTLLSRLAKPDGPLQSPSRGIYEAA